MIVYLHGFNSSPASFKARLIEKRLRALHRADEFVCPKLPWRFSEAAGVVDTCLEALGGTPVCLVGSSLGGFYATHFAEKYDLAAVLVNPAARPYESLARYPGPQRNLYTGEDYLLEAWHVDELPALEVPRITHLERYLLLTRTGDEVLDYREAVAKYAGCEQMVLPGGDHGFGDFAAYVDTVIGFADRHAATRIMRA